MNLTGPKVFVVDIECDALLDDLTKLHVMSVGYVDDSGQWQIRSYNDPAVIQKLVGNPENTIIGHNFIQYDKRALIKLGWEFNAKIIDTLGLSWYLYADRQLHGLESYGLDFGVPKPVIEDWSSLSYEEYRHRCEEDVKININVWAKIYKLIMDLYADEGGEASVSKVTHLLNFQLEILTMQEENRIYLNKELAESNLLILQKSIEYRLEALLHVMPKIPVIAMRSKPKSMYKKPISKPTKMFVKSGDLTPAGQKWLDLLEARGLPEDYSEDILELSAAGEKWMELLKRAGLSEDYDGDLKEIVRMDLPNPSSTTQVKNWLTSLGWVPQIFVDGANGPVPQLRNEDKELCESILELKKSIPEIEHLEGLSVAQHRAGVLKNFLKHVREDGTIVAEASKFTRTFRYGHKGCYVNLPSNTSTHGELIRICLEAPAGYDWVNCDLKSLESKASNIAVSPYASYEYINKPANYDPHIELSVAANLMSVEEGVFYSWYSRWSKGEDAEENCPDSHKNMSTEKRKEESVRIGDLRAIGKKCNYSILYGIGAAKLSKQLGISQTAAKKIIDAYWEIHKPVKEFTKTLVSKTVDDRDWVYSPFTKLWINYKGDHNKFNAVIQNFGAVVHARLMYFYVQHGIKIIANYHDECSWYWPKGQQEECKKIVATCVDLLNQSFGFDIKFEATPEFADSYGLCH